MPRLHRPTSSPRAQLALVPFLAIFAAASGGCGVEARSVLGDQCDLTTDCDAPLVCGLGRCRNECVANRDCGLGLQCLYLQEEGYGVCQLEEEKSCSLNSDCATELVCNTTLGCIIACVEDRDCAGGQICEEMQCQPQQADLCAWDSDCDYPLICARDLSCQTECTEVGPCGAEPGRFCVGHPACSGPCMCRRECTTTADCPIGLECVPCEGDETECPVAMFCERPAE